MFLQKVLSLISSKLQRNLFQRQKKNNKRMASWFAVTVLLMLSYQNCAHTETSVLKEEKNNNTSNLDLTGPNLGISWRHCLGFSSPDEESTFVSPCCQSFPSLSTRHEDTSMALAADTSCSKVRETVNVCLLNEACETGQENPVLKQVQMLLEQSKALNSTILPAFLKKLRTLTVDFSKEVTGSPPTIEAIVMILNNVAASALLINKDYMEDILFTTDVLTREEAKMSWIFLNRNINMNNRTHKIYPTNKGIHIASTLLLSLQGVFLLIFGVLPDKKVKQTLVRRWERRMFRARIGYSYKIEMEERAQLEPALPNPAQPDPALCEKSAGNHSCHAYESLHTPQNTRMTFTKAASFAVVFLFLCYNLQNREYWQSVISIFEDQLNSFTHRQNVRERREASVLPKEFTFEVTIGFSDINTLQEFLKSLNLSLTNSSSEITSSENTTECTSTETKYQCTCQKNYAWSYNACVSYGTCDGSTTGDTCGCIKGRPKNEYCQLNLTSTALPNTTAMTTASTTVITTESMTTRTAASTIEPTTKKDPSPTQSPEQRILTFTMDLDFKDSFNDKNSKEYKDVSGAIQKKCGEVTPPCSFIDLKFRSGSTIADYTISAPSITPELVSDIKAGVFSDLSATYPVIFDSDTSINAEVFALKKVTVNCATPPPGLGFDSNLTPEWTLNGKKVQNGLLYSIGDKRLTVSGFTEVGNVNVECRQKSGILKTFRQKGVIVVKETPRITVNPVQRLLQCGVPMPLKCSVQEPYKVKFTEFGVSPAKEVTYTYQVPDNCESSDKKIICQLDSDSTINEAITLKFTTQEFLCKGDPVFGDGLFGSVAKVPCDPDKVGEITAECMENKTFGNIQENCVLKAVQDLLDQSGGLNNENLPQFLDKLKGVALNSSKDISSSSATISAIVTILGNVASKPLFFNQTLMENVLLTTDVLTGDDAKGSWQFINNNDFQNRNDSNSIVSSNSSLLLESLENISSIVQGDSFSIVTPLILFNKTVFTDSFSEDFNSSVAVDLQVPGKTPLTVITFSSLNNVLPSRYLNESDSSKTINAKIVLIRTNVKVDNISLTFDVVNDTLGDPVCAFWNFSRFDGFGGWDDEGCFFVSDENNTVRCRCNHLTSFSVLMSPSTPKDPALDFITYAGVTISIVSLIICLIIEAIVWREVMKNGTSLLRHVCIVNVALSLLIANIWFIIMAFAVETGGDNGPLCTAVTFFNHFFYLAMFFWMLDSALLLLVRTMSVFGGGLSDMALLGLGFALGYGAPLIIASITIASTAGPKEYIQGCWLNWDDSRALLAFVIPALAIVLINFIILIIVLYKIFRSRSQSAQAGDKHILFVIAKSVAVLTPLFGLTWCLGIGLLVRPDSRGIHYSFAFFNSLQGFFILVFGTLLDKKVRSDLAKTSKSIFSGTRSTSGGSSSTGIFRNWRARRGAVNGYHISASDSNNSSGNT
ncbi:hypothetical protein OJAV_G00230680 [Oryzias javanicus]|uniref:GPS domain-containing protein n=1 Tax=Oryzias javanicus TaxID=123683 RepID=A0A3S2TUZ8_ORYJA|nr:hypothetical protein OJAV_G00230680 [Oryzias javanicus]